MDHVDSPYRPVPANERMSPHYRGKTVTRLGVGHVLLALISAGMQIALFVLKSPGYEVATGFWCGTLYLIAGVAAFVSSSDARRRPPAVAFLFAALVAGGAAVASVLVSLHFAISYKPGKGQEWSVQLILLATLTVLGIAETLVAILSVHLVCKGLCHCCVAVQQALENEAAGMPGRSPDKAMSPIPA